MKKLFVCLVGVFAMSLSVSAQENAVWGIRAGVNVTNLTGKAGGESESLDSRIGFNVGVSYQQPLVSKLFLETGLNLTSRGANANADMFDGEGGNKLKFNMLYLQVPVAISWHFDINNFSIQPAVGVYYGLGISGKVKMDGSDGELNIFKETDIEGEEIPQIAKRSDFGMRFGVGFAIHQRYYIGLGYDLGLMNIAKDGSDFDGVKIKNGSFYISVGYNF